MKVKIHEGERYAGIGIGFLTVDHWHWWHHQALLSVDFGMQFLCYVTLSVEVCSISVDVFQRGGRVSMQMGSFFYLWVVHLLCDHILYELWGSEVFQTISTEREHVARDSLPKINKRWKRACSCHPSSPHRQHPPPSPALPIPMWPAPVLCCWSSTGPTAGEHRWLGS